MTLLRPARLLAPALLLAGAALLAPTLAPARTAKAPAPSAARGLAFAKAHCAACHGVTANSSSPNPEAPPWDDIANWEGVTARTFATFLTDAHNYPLAMDVTVPRAAIRDLAAYLVTLRKPGYRPTR